MMKIFSRSTTALSILFICLLLSIKIYASDPNLDTSTHIVTFPRITVDNDSTFVNVQLLLNSDGTYQILSSTPETSVDLSGSWKGTLPSTSFSSCFTDAEFTLKQDGNKLSGKWRGHSICIGSGGGDVVGIINGNNIEFTLYINGSEIKANVTVADDQRTMSGSYVWLDLKDYGNWSTSLQ